MTIKELKDDMIFTLNASLREGFPEHIDPRVIQNWIDDLTEIERSDNKDYAKCEREIMAVVCNGVFPNRKVEDILKKHFA